MIKRIKLYKDLPIEEGKTYKTRFATGDMFFVKRVVKKLIKFEGNTVERIVGYEGIYWEHKDIGVCPLGVDRLIPERILDGVKIVCDDPEFDLTKLISESFKAGEENTFSLGDAFGIYLEKFVGN